MCVHLPAKCKTGFTTHFLTTKPKVREENTGFEWHEHAFKTPVPLKILCLPIKRTNNPKRTQKQRKMQHLTHLSLNLHSAYKCRAHYWWRACADGMTFHWRNRTVRHVPSRTKDPAAWLNGLTLVSLMGLDALDHIELQAHWTCKRWFPITTLQLTFQEMCILWHLNWNLKEQNFSSLSIFVFITSKKLNKKFII